MEKESFAKIFGLNQISRTDIIKLLTVGMLMGKAEEKAKIALQSNPGITRDIRRRTISQNIGKRLPGLDDMLTSEQAETLINYLNQNAEIFSRWI